ncbi:IS481 family transposase [Shewanella algae]|uniref:IS481 family transposase n=1 Tax=Shewanella algae TaxID=38313 RepID=UPI001F3A61DE|nr:IS481 family transposase [Shewanella algae]MCE9781220.1 IS481 family transposase [Shewanella algae]MCE9827315.1 IS481 family transposase [Shewanella algae]
MPWKEVSAVNLRTEFVAMASLPDANISLLCQRFQISRKTAYKWLNRAVNGEVMCDRSRKPLCSPNKTLSSIEDVILDARRLHPEWGGRKLKRHLENMGIAGLPAASTITEILRRNALLNTSSAPKQPNWQRFEHPHPNDLWQMDFKGPIDTKAGKAFALTVLDDHSRFSLGIQVTHGTTFEETKEHLSNVFQRYGLPYRMTMDNGSPWGNPFGKWSRFTLWQLDHDIKVSHSRPYHPQTQGKDERFHRTLKEELLKRSSFETQGELQRACDEWRHIYNHIRPHTALNLDSPASHYQLSKRKFNNEPTAFEYGADYEVRSIQPNGYVNYRGQCYKVAEVFRKLRVGIRPTLIVDQFEIYYRHQKIGELKLRGKL